jgi:hypothetical protein
VIMLIKTFPTLDIHQNTVDMQYSWICIYKFAYLIKYICSLNTYGTFCVISRHVQSSKKNLSCLKYIVLAEMEQGDTLLSLN